MTNFVLLLVLTFYLHYYETILVLNSSYEPINFTNWRRAVILALKEKVQVISERVIRLLNYIKVPINYVARCKPSRAMIYKRDRNTCQYCGATTKLTIDHVVPRSRGGDASWENLVVACSSCNTKKGNRLLEHTSIRLLRQPRAPWNKVAFDLYNCNVPEWKEYSYE